MSKFKVGEKVKIVKHPGNPDYCGLVGKVSDIREVIGPATQGVTGTGELPPLGKQL